MNPVTSTAKFLLLLPLLFQTACVIEMDEDEDKAGSETKAQSAAAQATAGDVDDDHWLFLDVELPTDVAAGMPDANLQDREVRSAMVLECPANSAQKGEITVAIVTASGDESTTERQRADLRCVGNFTLKVRRAWRLGTPQSITVMIKVATGSGAGLHDVTLGGTVSREELLSSNEVEHARVVLSSDGIDIAAEPALAPSGR